MNFDITCLVMFNLEKNNKKKNIIFFVIILIINSLYFRFEFEKLSHRYFRILNQLNYNNKIKTETSIKWFKNNNSSSSFIFSECFIFISLHGISPSIWNCSGSHKFYLTRFVANIKTFIKFIFSLIQYIITWELSRSWFIFYQTFYPTRIKLYPLNLLYFISETLP